MTKVVVQNLTSTGPSSGYQAYLGVTEDLGFVEVSGSVFKKETYLLTDGIHFSLIQFDGDIKQDRIREFFENRRGNYKVIKIEKDTLVMES